MDNIVDATFVSLVTKKHDTTKFASNYASGRTSKIMVCNGNLSEIVVQRDFIMSIRPNKFIINVILTMEVA